MSVLIAVDFKPKEGFVETVGDILRGALGEIRAYEGCQGIDVHFDATTQTYTALETWETDDHYKAYLKWREDNGIAAAVEPVMDGGWDAVRASIKWLGPKTDI